MYTVLIVEDEMLVSVGLRNMIRWSDMNMTIIGDARNGKQGLELYQQKKPDIILTDIRMPVMDGLEMIAQIRREDQATRIVVLSSYEDFELVRQAFVLGISDYILKLKMMPEEMENVMRKVQRELLENEIPQSGGRAEEIQENERKIAQKAMEYILQNKGNGEDFQTLARQMQIAEEGLAVCMMETEKENISEQESDREHTQKIGRAIQNLLQNLLLEHHRGIVWNTGRERYLIVLGLSAKKSVKEREQIQKELIDRMGRAVQSGMNRNTFWGVSRSGDSFGILHELSREAEEALEKALFLDEQILYCTDRETDSKYAEILHRFQGRLSGQEHKADGYLPKIMQELDFLQQNDMICPDSMREIIIRWIHGISFGGGIWQKELMELALHAVENVRSAVSLQEMLQVFERYLDEKYCSIRNSRTLNRELARAVSYIHAHYAESDLSLSRVAEEVSISKDYLSRLFKRETGIGFSDYVNIQRIQKAQELLVTTQMRSYEIAREVGFQDESYFSRVFKNTVGMRPNEYKRQEMISMDLSKSAAENGFKI